MFGISQKLILNQKDEIFGTSSIKWKTIPWMRTTLLHDRAAKLSKAKVQISSDSVFFLAKCMNILNQEKAWKQKIELFAK